MTLANLNKRAMQLGRERNAKIAAKKAEADKSTMMTPEEKAVHLANWTREYTRVYDLDMAELKDDAEYYARQVTEDGQRARPAFDANSAADLTRTEQAWRNVVLPQLEKGRTLSEALRNADQDAALGAERFAAAYLNANQPDSGFMVDAQDHTAAVRAAVTERFADLAEPGAAATLRAAARVDTELAAFHQVTAMTTEGNNLEAAITAHYAQAPAESESDSVDA